MLLAGLTMGIAGSILVLLLLPILSTYSFLHFSVFTLTLAITTIAVACLWGAIPVKSYLLGMSTGISAAGGVAFLLLMGRTLSFIWSEQVVLFWMSPLLLWPLLLTAQTLQGIWSWDDAFPEVACQPIASLPTQQPLLARNEEEEGISFEDEDRQAEPSPSGEAVGRD